jgi:hypothetical protein
MSPMVERPPTSEVMHDQTSPPKRDEMARRIVK